MFFRRAVASSIKKNPYPYDGEPFYNLGLSLFMQNKKEEAFDAFYKSVWSREWKAAAYYHMSIIKLSEGKLKKAMNFIEESLLADPSNNLARNILTVIHRKLGNTEEALTIALESIKRDSFNFGAFYEKMLLLKLSDKNVEAQVVEQKLHNIMDDNIHNYLELVIEYMRAGLFEEASMILMDYYAVHREYSGKNPIVLYYMGYIFHQIRDEGKAIQFVKEAESLLSNICFPHRLESIAVLNWAIQVNPSGAKASYYLGNLYYDKKHYEKAIQLWKQSVELDSSFPIVQRNLSIASYNKLKDADKARIYMEEAFENDRNNARILFELDQLDKKMGLATEMRIKRLQDYWELVESRDDLYLEYVTLENLAGNFEKAIELLDNHSFHPWEGGEGKVTGQYVFAHVQLGRKYLESGQTHEAIEKFEKAQHYPVNLGEGKLTGTRENNIYYYLGIAHEKSGDKEKAHKYLKKAATGNYQPSLSMYYYDKASDMIFYQGMAFKQLGLNKEADSKFHSLIDYGEKHLFDTVKIDYFAISLPDFLVFDEDLQKRNQINCHYLMGLGFIGLEKYRVAKDRFNKVIDLDVSHIQARMFSKDIPDVTQ